MKKLTSVIAVIALSSVVLAGCESMTPSQQRIGAAAAGGAIGGGVGNKVGGGIGAALGGGAGAAVGSKPKVVLIATQLIVVWVVQSALQWVKAFLVVTQGLPLVVPSVVVQVLQLSKKTVNLNCSISR